MPPISDLRTIPEILRCQAQTNGATPALIDTDGATLSYETLWQEIQSLASSLRPKAQSCEPGRPARLGIVLPNGLNISVALLATTSFATAVPFNPAQTRPEFEAQFAATRIDAVLLPNEHADRAAQAAQALSIPIIRLSDDRHVADADHEQTAAPAPDPDDIALVLTTSGSTGQPKIVPLSHRNVCRSALDVARSLELTPQDRCLSMWEQFHIGGLVDLLLAPLVCGSSLIAAGSFDAPRFFELQDKFRATWFQGVPTSLGEIALQASRSGVKSRLSGLRFFRSVAAALSPAAQENLVAQFGVPVVRTLGMTEAAPLITTTQPSLIGDKPGSVGRSAGPEVTILSDAGDELPHGETGQVAIKGENVFAGYEHNPEANRAAFRNGWFLTGDLGYLDAEGDLFLSGRAKEMINRGGEKISPNEVEDALLAHPAIHEAACYSIPHATLGEDIGCALATTSDLTVQDVRSHLTVRVARHKIPGQIQFLSKLPRNPVGKIDRQALAGQTGGENYAPVSDEPLTPMQSLVANIWKEELLREDVGLDVDFASVDGDSLSAVRILVSLETFFDTTMPTEIIEQFATVRDLAKALEAHGFDASSAAIAKSPEHTQTKEMLAEQIVFSGDISEAETMMAQANGRADLRLKLDYIIAHLSPHKVRDILDALEDVAPCSDSAPTGFVERLRIKREFAKQLKEQRQYLHDTGDGAKWRRQDLAPGVMLYSDPAIPSAKKDLIVGFGGNRMRLLMPAFRVLAGVDSSKADLLLLADHQRKLFLEGIPSLGGDVHAVARYIDRFCADAGYTRLLGVGASGGSLAVLVAGISAGFDAIACIAPASLAKHVEWTKTFEGIAPQHDPDQTTIRVVHGRREEHRAAAESIREFLPGAELIRYPHASKRILPDAQERGLLRESLHQWTA